MSPIQEDRTREHSPVPFDRIAPAPPQPLPLATPSGAVTALPRHDHHAPLAPVRRPSGDAPRPLPSPAGHRRSVSHTPGLNTPGYSTASDSMPSHTRALSDSATATEASAINANGGRRSSARRPLPTPTVSNGAGHLHVIQRSGSASSTSLASVSSPLGGYLSPAQPSASLSTSSLVSGVGGMAAPVFHDPRAGHGHGLESDDAASFYMAEPAGRIRSPPPMEEEEEGEPGDPALLFPAVVRGAGYRGTPR